MEKLPHLIIIDDDRINNSISKMLIGKLFNNVKIKDFLMPEEGLDYITSTYSNGSKDSVILLLDINMPIMSGWEFLQRFSGFDESFKNKFKIYVVSASIDYEDIELAKSNENVAGFLSKPISKEAILSIFK